MFSDGIFFFAQELSCLHHSWGGFHVVPLLTPTHLKLQLHPQPWSWATARPRQQSDVRPARRASVVCLPPLMLLQQNTPRWALFRPEWRPLPFLLALFSPLLVFRELLRTAWAASGQLHWELPVCPGPVGGCFWDPALPLLCQPLRFGTDLCYCFRLVVTVLRWPIFIFQ